MVNRFTSKSQQVLQGAKKCAEKMGHTYIGTEHLLLGILNTECIANKLLSEKKISHDEVQDKIAEISGSGSFSTLSINELTPKCRKIIEKCSVISKKFGSKFIGTEHILYSICDDGESVGARILSSFGINLFVFKNEIATFLDASCEQVKVEKQEIPGASVLSQYAKNLNTMALKGKIDPLVRRDDELERVIRVLCRRTKNNPCLIGEPGVGKTAIVEGLACKIVQGEVPDLLQGKTVVSLDLSSMIAGAKYRGEFEERMKGILNELKSCEGLILFIDEIHTLIGAGSAEGAVDAANIIKPALARGSIQLIGATTISEYRRYIEKDAALERRFQPVRVDEPSSDAAYEMLLALKPKYEKHHNVEITDEALRSAVTLSQRYINDRFLPDKAIDLIDEAASAVRMKHFEAPNTLKECENKIKELSKLKEDAIIEGDFALASIIRDDEILSRIEYNKKKARHEKKLEGTRGTVTPADIQDVVSKWTGVPVALSENEGEGLRNLEALLKERIIGQDHAVSLISSAIKRGRIGLRSPRKPVGSFLLLGPTGVGKTELARAISSVLFGEKTKLIRLDMSEYMEKHSVSKLIGAPAGYIGYENGGILTEAVRKNPYSVVLFDEIEKAHSDIFNILLQILDNGTLTDSSGRCIDFKNTIVILTSNIGAKEAASSRGVGFSFERSEAIQKEQIISALKRKFSPELINRLDEIVVFSQLDKNGIYKIAKIMLNEITELAKGINIELSFDDSAAELISSKGYDKEYGARHLRRLITTLIENELSERILNNEIAPYDCVLVIAKNGYLEFEKKKKE